MARKRLWPTPTKGSATAGYTRDPEKVAAGRRQSRRGHEGNELLRRVHRRRVPTPTKGDARSSGSRNLPGSKANTGVSLTDFVRTGDSSTPRQPGGALNPAWVEWLMAWPIGWTGSRPLETDKFRSWLRSLSCTLRDAIAELVRRET